MKLFFILGNQLFPTKYIDRFKKDHTFFMAEDKGLCTYEKHHKQKILLFYPLCDPTQIVLRKINLN
jgi:deoxyribodipyrimidine photolyase-related protein